MQRRGKPSQSNTSLFSQGEVSAVDKAVSGVRPRLRDLAKPTNAHRSSQGFRLFESFLTTFGLGVGDLHTLPSPRVVALASSFVEVSFEQEVPLDLVQAALTALGKRHARLRDCLGEAWRFCSEWKTWRGVRHRAPLPAAAAQAMLAVVFSFAAQSKSVQQRQHWLEFGLVFWITWAAFLRPGEGAVLQVEDFRFSLNGCISVFIRNPKTRRYCGSQAVLVTDPALLRYCRCVLGSRSNSPAPSGSAENAARAGQVFPFSYAVFSSRFASVRLAAGLPSIFTPASLRAGSATYALQCNTEVARIRLAGRWLSERTLLIYLQSALSVVHADELSAKTLGLSLLLPRGFENVMSLFPNSGPTSVGPGRYRFVPCDQPWPSLLTPVVAAM